MTLLTVPQKLLNSGRRVGMFPSEPVAAGWFVSWSLKSPNTKRSVAQDHDSLLIISAPGGSRTNELISDPDSL